MDIEVLWARVVPASIGLIASSWILLRLVLESRTLRRQGMNGEILHAYEGLRRGARTLAIGALLGCLSAVNPSWRRDRALIWIGLWVIVWMAVRLYRDRRQAELMAGKRLSQGVS